MSTLRIRDRTQEFKDGHACAVSGAIAWLHRRADTMNDNHAKAVLNSAAFNLGVEVKGYANKDG